MELVFVRHGESEANLPEMVEGGLYCGRWNCALTEKGILQARALKGNSAVCGADVIFCSPLLRTRQTAAEFADREITIDERLVERTLGDFDGKWKSELMKNEEYKKYFTDPALLPFRSSFTVAAPGGENYTDVVKRVSAFLSDLKNESFKKAVVVSHCVAIKCMMKVLKNLSEDEIIKLKIRQCEPIILEY